MRQLLASIFTLLLTAAFTFGFDARTKAEIDELMTFVRTSGVRFIRNGKEYSGVSDGQEQVMFRNFPPVRIALARFPAVLR